jgi:hypothetical protein
MSYRAITVPVVLTSLLAISASVRARDAALTQMQGRCADVYKGQVCTTSTMRGTTLVDVGAVIPLASIENAPAEMPMAWPPVPAAWIELSDAVRQQTGFQQFTVDWNAGGHPPAAFMTPHFDFHFYVIPRAEIAAIDCKSENKPAALPAGYTLPDIPLPPEMAGMMGVSTLVGLCVPQMGMHAVPATEVARTDAFGATMVIGYYKGTPIFIEPMISKAMLMKKASFDLPLPNVPGLKGPRPTKFHAEYDATQQVYRFTLSGFVAA